MKNFIKFMVLGLGLSSCGSKSSDDSAQPAQETGVATSYYVNTASELVACDVSKKGFLVYIKNTDQFMACLENGWSVVNVKGKDGAQGTTGISGSVGSTGSTGATGAAGTPTSANQWYDAITTKMWVMTTIATTVAGWNNSMSACTGSYRMPSPAEVTLALTHGMKAVAQALVNPPTFILANDGQTYVINTGLLGSNATAAQFCIAQ